VNYRIQEKIPPFFIKGSGINFEGNINFLNRKRGFTNKLYLT
jgi:hypothetical protein